MKLFCYLAVLIVHLAFLPQIALATWQTWTVDARQSDVSFVAVKDDAVPVSGKIPGVSGSFKINKNSGAVTGVIEFALDAVTTGNAARDATIANVFFQVASKGKTATLYIDKASGKLANFGKVVTRYQVQGRLVLVGVTAPVQFEVIVAPLPSGGSLVYTTSPIAIRFADFGLGQAASLLKQVCNHQYLLELATVSAQLFIR